MPVEVMIEDVRWAAGLPARAMQAAEATLETHGLDSTAFEIALLACDDARIAELNRDFRDKPQATNVLSWPAQDLAAKDDGGTPQPPETDDWDEDPHHLGDIALAYETCAREAEAQGKPFSAHVTHLIVHGVLHLLGYDHIRDADATLMERLEREILCKLGIPDPYREIEGPRGL